MNKDTFSYLTIRFFSYPFKWMSYPTIRRIGCFIGWCLYYCMRTYRKKTLSNLALASALSLTPKEIRRIAKQSFQNLAINCLEYPKLEAETDWKRAIVCENPQAADDLHRKGQGLIFFCGHQANWEVLFLEGTSRMKGIAIGKPIKNKQLYNWILSIREKNGGMITPPRNAIKEGLRALKKGSFIGIVGDQGMPGSGYSFPFLGRRAWTSTAPALLAYKTNCPIVFAKTKRAPHGYQIRYSDPIWPNLEEPIEKETVRLMDEILKLLEESIQASPGEWLWQHNRWKQQTPQIVYKRFRQDAILIILPKDSSELFPHLKTFREIYPLSFLFVLAPQELQNTFLLDADEIIYYKNPQETLLDDYRFKLIFDFTNNPKIAPHYEKLSAFETLTLSDLKNLVKTNSSLNISELLKQALCRPGTII